MNLPSFKSLSPNILPGLVVSLVALPLGLGLALASGAPPMAGIISAIVGAVVLFFLGGSYVVISGPGNGLVVVTLFAISSLGAGDAFLGYQLTLAAIVASGGILLLLGFFRFGALAEFFPSSAIKGMLAAIGLIILSRQIHVLIGINNPSSESAPALLSEITKSIKIAWFDKSSYPSAILGILSLILLFVLPSKGKSWLSKIPAPMWVISLGMGYSYLSAYNPHIFPAFADDHLLSLPDNLQNSIVFPNFSAWASGGFISIAFSLAFIAAIESLLSIKAVDKLDPEHRRSNVNKDLRALGLATMISGFIGGLNVVAVIARSSVNVNNGATERWSNLFQGVFIGLFFLLFSTQLQFIPISVLAAILVYTGYKLTAPAQFKSMAAVGWEELSLFIITYLATLFTNLITGILIGIFATLILQLFGMGRSTIFFRNLFRPNTLLYEEESNKYHLSVKSFATFLNFLRIKNHLDTLSTQAEVIVDFSLTTYVDYSVLEHLHQYKSNFQNGGGHLEIIGLDDLGRSSSHPMANRHPRKFFEKRTYTLTRRQKALRLFALSHEYQFDYHEIDESLGFQNFDYFKFKPVNLLRNRLSPKGEVDWLLADVHYQEGGFYGNQDLHATMLSIPLSTKAPLFVIDRESLLDKVAFLAGFKDIVFELYPDFSNRFKVKGEDEQAIKKFLSRAIIDFLEEHKSYHIECNGEALLIFEKERHATISEIKQMVNFAVLFSDLLKKEHA
ncbi:MAG: sulfate transporter [Bacteroidetes bacterium]|nr:MAG: sulfate transporter [Bacteroidota bacterium]